ncbi:DUF6517 family protein [Halosegnis marinus]|uniref:DUF6517 family protein n=1 Tax=Halosegnis marinus TaxID=3034023 RepID=A0ABD5ZR64_9EURY|nr:DUF6517 family protein [Halosegnis sp. DT85]
MENRRAAAALALAALLLTSGCIGFLTGSESLTFEAESVAVSDAALEETGYSEQRVTTDQRNRTFSVAGQEREVSVTNHLAEYSRAADTLFGDQQVARFTAFSTPQVRIAGQGPFNPVSDLSNRELALRLQEQYSSIDNIRFESNRTLTTLGQEVRVSKFRADATLSGGQEVEVFLHITQIEHEGDYVIAVGVHPTRVDEQANIDALIEGLDHPA